MYYSNPCMQTTSLLCCIIVSPVAHLVLLYFYTLSHKWHNFWKKVTEHKSYVLILSTTFVSNIRHSKKNSVTCYLTLNLPTTTIVAQPFLMFC
jgi:hypothetical protein